MVLVLDKAGIRPLGDDGDEFVRFVPAQQVRHVELDWGASVFAKAKELPMAARRGQLRRQTIADKTKTRFLGR
jgi:hypothetical protein